MSSAATNTISGVKVELVPSTKVQNGFGEMLDKAKRGAVIAVTSRNKPSAVLLSVEVFEALLAERLDPLAHLRERFDERLASMRKPGARAGLESLFIATPKELGRSAVEAAKKGV